MFMKNIKKISYLVILFVVLFSLVSPVFADMEACNSLSDGLDIDSKIASTVHIIILFLQIAIPVLLVIFGSIDFLKAVTSSKEDEIKKGQQTFIKRLIAAVIVFFVVAIVKLLVSFAASDDSATILNCADCFLSGPDSEKCSVSAGQGNSANSNQSNSKTSKKTTSNQKAG